MGGLFSMSKLRQSRSQILAPGGNEWSQDADVRFGLDVYVHLCLMSEHPMEFLARQEGRIQQSIFLQISPEILGIDGVKFAPGVANRSGMPLLSLAEACEQMDLEVVYDRTDWKDPEVQRRRKEAKKYEILVPDLIPLKFIQGL
jgi:hypothetical protein